MMKGHSDVEGYLQFWRNMGYKIAYINPDPTKKLEEMTNEQLLNISFGDILIAKDIQSINSLY